MFKFAKYLFLQQWYKKAKKHMFSFFIFSVLFIVSTYLFSDLIAMSNEKLVLVIVKWIAIVLLLGVITYNIIEIFKSMPIPFKKENDCKEIDIRKENIVQKEYLLGRSELIMKKYKEHT